MAIFRRGTPLTDGGVKCKGYEKSRFSTIISLYFGNDARQSHNYYGRRIGNRTKLSNGTYLDDLQWPSNFKVTIIQRRITRKWYNTELYLQWPTNRKSYMIYRTAPRSMTLNDPYPRFQGHAILWRWISQKRYEIHSFNGILIGT